MNKWFITIVIFNITFKRLHYIQTTEETMAKEFNIERIFKSIELNDNEKRVLKTILNNPITVQSNGIRKLAEDSFSSPASIERLSKKLGYAGYSELVYHAKIITATSNQINDRELNQLSPLEITDFQNKLKTILNRKNYIYLYGEGFNEFVTKYIYRKLLVNHFQTLLLNGIEIPLVYESNQNPVLLLISRSGENHACLEKIDQINQVNGKLISITSNANSTISQKSDIPIFIRDEQQADAANVSYTTFFGDCINSFERILAWVNEDEKKREIND